MNRIHVIFQLHIVFFIKMSWETNSTVVLNYNYNRVRFLVPLCRYFYDFCCSACLFYYRGLQISILCDSLLRVDNCTSVIQLYSQFSRLITFPIIICICMNSSCCTRAFMVGLQEVIDIHLLGSKDCCVGPSITCVV